MELCGVTAIAWSKSISPTLHSPQTFSVWRFRRTRTFCASSGNDSAQSPKTDEMIVSITGATGFIGKRLVQRLHADNHRVRVLTRSRSKALSIFPGKKFFLSSTLSSYANYHFLIQEYKFYIYFFLFPSISFLILIVSYLPLTISKIDLLFLLLNLFICLVRDFPGVVIAEEPEWRNYIQGSTAVVNLAGTPISTRWSPDIKKDIKESRIKVTSKVVDIINNSQDELRPKVLINATAIGYYGTSQTRVFDEQSPSGNDYLAEVCREWETAALRVDKDVRLALIRIGVVLGKEGGALAKMIPIFMMFAGGPLGSGKQWFSWIHVDDLVNLIYEALSNPSYKGVINGTAPNPVRMSEICEQLGSVLGRPSWLPVPDIALKAALGEGACVVLEGQKVVPARAKELGFSFKYPHVKDALKAIMS
ncbi:hypothetical protein BUALT_Bualt15G0017400 [Buddleja alternifolia]|uniref:Uncharacterized protein n=1 Tax=Buddleja alternifolia TaxID=168488 RepID=A0AAV6WIC7_9LAMI|nr:hypothetical protein BUALT_Bualt15G0017400 [Buddleja alternifolia]